MQRVIVNLAKTTAPVADQVDALTQRFPQARVVRLLAGFHQVVLELPSAQIKELEGDSQVDQVALDRPHDPSNAL